MNIITLNAMIRVRLKIEDGEIYDTADKYGMVYVKADKRFAAPIKDFAKSSYPEQSGVNVIAKTTDKEFEYKVTFFIKTDSLVRANKKISHFNSQLYTQEGDIKTFKRVTLYDDYKEVTIVGYPQPIKEATEFWRDNKGVRADVVCAEWTIFANDPSLCNFDSSDVYVAGNAVVIDGDISESGNIIAGVEVYIESETIYFKEI